MHRFSFRAALMALALAVSAAFSASALAESKTALEHESKVALGKLIAKVPAAKSISDKAVAVLVFPSITKAGLGLGGQYGEGVLWRDGKPVAYYSNAGASVGMQFGAQKYAYAMFFMNDAALAALGANEGFKVGAGPTLAVVDQGMSKTVTSDDLNKDIYAFVATGKGLMAGMSIQGNKITKLDK
jgi:lipid-binding SYLF domain-containing protein